ncbi:hypothetical protein ACFPVX_21090 [Cohnella faecalis]|uniref:Signal transduction histidine kinase n=1 Tax=Cohnella faecalis TaxID=2315694 RepID=A0A398CLB8_9BACL|nr:hypothetical protein [Cohnella faecalis]RIE03060.1 hypothetical protein D3H35_20975 [Cohnella faecalis]
MPSDSNLVFIIAAFAFGVVLILTKERLPAPMRRGIAITAALFVAFAFFLIVYSFMMAGL